ncbi:hypothetical protein HK099_006234 [Clydaea vesicula]|uniref:Uncharacterized protein n=1 Tax=Clydaea vesicula TaxID=447962 RepID=A0AAD5U2P9_9FUNG|nr:hypothetical protein HK099_006234 [Clydaea vesicula]
MLFQSVDQNEWNEAKNSYKKAIETIANKKKTAEGTFRPALLKNVESNSEDLIASSFTESLKLLTEGNCLGALKTFSKNLKVIFNLLVY